MRLSGLVSLLDDLPEFRRLVAAVARRRPALTPAEDHALPPPAATATIREAAKPFLVTGLHRRAGRPIVLVAQDATRAQEWYGDLLTWSDAPQRVLHFPAFDALPYEQLPAVAETVAGRVGTLIQLAAEPPPSGAAKRHERRSALPRRHQRPGPADHAAPAGGVRGAGARPPRRRALRHAAPGAPARRQRVRAGGPGGDAGLVQPAGGHRGHLPPSRRGPGAPGVLRRRGGEHPGVRSGDAALHRDA